MNWQQFAIELFTTEDSDPGYQILARLPVPIQNKKRFMVAWVTFYNLGLAAKASELSGEAFWKYIYTVYPTAKRNSERRHFRGQAGLKAIDTWWKMFPMPSKMVDYMEGKDYFEVRENAKTVPQFGDYFVWKWADVQERVFRTPCIFPDKAAACSPKVPQQGAKIIRPDWTILNTYNLIAHWMNSKGMKSPPWYDRPMNMQEAETVCCVYKQYKKGKWCSYSRTAKAVRSLLATPSDTAELALQEIASRIGVTSIGLEAWQNSVLAKL